MMNKTMLALLLIILTGCATPPIEVTTETIRLLPPGEFLQSTQVPSMIGDDNESLLVWSLELDAALEACNLDKTSILEWGKDK